MSDINIVKLSEYQAPAFSVERHELHFYLDDGLAEITHQQWFKREGDVKDLLLDGEALTLKSIELDGQALDSDRWSYDGKVLVVHNVPDIFSLTTIVSINADENKELSGLYRSNGIYCTQCEAQGFRRISFALDRPDVLSTYRVCINAPKNDYPVMLSNGNLIEQGDLDGGRHYVTWQDPHPKPSYLFALVAGKLAEKKQQITTGHGHEIDLHIYTEAAFIHQTDFAMQALIDAINWDEKRFNLDYDLGRFNIVAISDFNMGAMENKSLNIFNTRYVLGDMETATDSDFHGIESVIGHEYFHNWTGNRITCRDWFQLSLKEGLTVFRDQEFSSDQGESSLERIENVNILRRAQFSEDASPLSHPVQPQEYAAIDNFYTATVYEKGAEIIRMYHTIIGEELFQEGMKLYVARHDGQAVRIEEFAQCMEDASGYPFSEQFFYWYTTKGTPHLSFSSEYDEQTRTLTLHAKQDCDKVSPARALVIPVRFSLMNAQGQHYDFGDGEYEYLWILNEAVESIEIMDIDADYLPVWMHNFTAPIYYDYEYDNIELVRIAHHGIDGFARFESMQRLYQRLFMAALAGDEEHYQLVLKETTALLANILNHEERSAGEKALLLTLPAIAMHMNSLPHRLNMDALISADQRMSRDIAQALGQDVQRYLEAVPQPSAASYSVKDAQLRALNRTLLHHLASLDDVMLRQRFAQYYASAHNMTERMSAINALNQKDDAYRTEAFADFAERFASYPLVIDKWYALQASAHDAGAFERIQSLAQGKGFVVTNPNRFRALIGAFAQNFALFHAKDGSGYRFVSTQIERVLTINPQLSARMINLFSILPRLDDTRRTFITNELNRLKQVEGASVDVIEIIERILQG